ncbi:AAA family ATPase [Acinetobacter sp.]|uniref:AAA family ATPase n=1 Tax=Acinetobacter sp. TaxID=472 RepID=UPI003750C73F
MPADTKTPTKKEVKEPQFNSNELPPELLSLLSGGAMKAAMISMLLGPGPMETGEVNIMRTGDKIILPEGMDEDQAIIWLRREKEARETEIAIHHSIPCFPLDGLHALAVAMKRTFGFTELKGDSGWWGNTPPHLVKVDIGSKGQFVQVPYCKMAPPSWGGGYIEPAIANSSALIIRGKIRKKHEASVKQLLELTEKIVRAESIYKGKAIKLDLSFLPQVAGGNIAYNPDEHRPIFMDVSEVTEDMLILNDETQHDLDISVMLRLKQPDACRANGISIKLGVLGSGSFGTGKSTAGLVVAAVAEQHNYTFINCVSQDQIVQAMELARMYAPAVLFCEDIDPIVSGQRNAQMNAVLEGLDGIEAKGKEVIYMFTTNFVDKINPAFMRPGRIDMLINFGKPDSTTAARFVKRFTTDSDGKSLLEPDADMTIIGAATEGNVPAAINEIVRSAKCRAMLRDGKELVGKVTTHDIAISASSKKRHLELTQERKKVTNAQMLVEAHRLIGNLADGSWEGSDEYEMSFA